MQKFLTQFLLTPGTFFHMEAFLFSMADKMIDGYTGGSWDDANLGNLPIVTIPGKDPLVTLRNEHSGTTITTDRLTASVAFLTLAVNWYWHKMNDRLTDAQQEAFYNYHHALRDAVYADDSGSNHADYFSFTD